MITLNNNTRCFIFFLCTIFPYVLHSGNRKRYKKKEKSGHIESRHNENINTNISAPSISLPTLPQFPNSSTQQVLNTKAPSLSEISKEATPSQKQEKIEQKGEKSTPVEDITNFKNKMKETEVIKEDIEEETEFIELNFENADLQNFIKQIEDLFEVTFIADDMVQPILQGKKPVKGNKISFKTHQPLSRKKTWDLFLTFLQISGFAVIEHNTPHTYYITTLEEARKSPIPAFIGVDYENLPDNDEIIRYVYFIENSSVDSIKNFVDPIRSSLSSFIVLQEHKAFILTDKARNIKSMMRIVKEVDKVSKPEVAVVIQLKLVDARQVKELYESLVQPDDKGIPQFGPRKQPTTRYFPEGTKIIAYPQGNKLILLGQKDTVQKIEEFITKYIDVEPSQAYSPFHIHPLRYADAVTIADIMNDLTKFGKDTEAGKSGGIRGQDQYLKAMSFIPEKESNRLIIKGTYEDYLKAKTIIEQLDEAQPQVGIEVLILSVNLDKRKSLGAQLRSKTPGGPDGILGKNVEFQTSGLFGSKGIEENSTATMGTKRLLGNMLNLVSGASPGNTIIALGKDLFGVWGVFQILETMTNAQVVSNPFLIATNKVPATVSLGEERRVKTATIVGTSEVDSFGKDKANLEVHITPQINSDGMILLDINIIFNDFIDSADKSSATKNLREIKTAAILADKEVLALGGLIRNKVIGSKSKTPILGDIPVLGWFFKNRQKSQVKQNLLILISSRIIEPHSERDVKQFTHNHIAEYEGTLDSIGESTEKHDPIHKLFFETEHTDTERIVEDFIFERHDQNYQDEKRKRRSRQTKNSNKLPSDRRNIAQQESSSTKNELDPSFLESTDSITTSDATNTMGSNDDRLAKIKQKNHAQLSLSSFLSPHEGKKT